MDPKVRIAMVRLAEKMRKNPECAANSGAEVVFKNSGRKTETDYRQVDVFREVVK